MTPPSWEMRRIRDAEARGSDKFLLLCEMPPFGSSSQADTSMPEEALSLKLNYHSEPEIQKKIDNHVFTRLLLYNAEATSKYFRTKLKALFPGANIQEGHSESADHDPDALTISFAPAKGRERALVKWNEYGSESRKTAVL